MDKSSLFNPPNEVGALETGLVADGAGFETGILVGVGIGALICAADVVFVPPFLRKSLAHGPRRRGHIKYLRST